MHVELWWSVCCLQPLVGGVCVAGLWTFLLILPAQHAARCFQPPCNPSRVGKLLSTAISVGVHQAASTAEVVMTKSVLHTSESLQGADTTLTAVAVLLLL